MDKAFKIGLDSASGSFKLFLGVAGSAIIMAVGTVILTRLLSPTEYGVYSIALAPSLMFTLFRDWGVNSAMTRNVAQSRTLEREGDARSTIIAGIAFEALLGLILSFSSLLTAGLIATTLFHRPESAPLISIVSASMFFGAMLTASQASLIGAESMGLNGITMVCQSLTKTAISIILVLVGYSALGAVIGYTSSFLIAGVFGLLAVYVVLLRRLEKKTNSLGIVKTWKAMLEYGVPFSISTILAGFLTQFYVFMMISFCSDLTIGNYQAAANFSILLTFFTTPISVVLFPAFAKLDPKKEQKSLETVFASSIKYTALLVVPATMAIMVLSKPMIFTLFGEKWADAPFFLILYVAGNLLSAIGSVTVSGFLAGVGETKILMKQSLLTLALGIPFAFLLIPTFGIPGVILGALAANIPSLLWGLRWIRTHYKMKPDLGSSSRILAASAIASVISYFSLNFLGTIEWIRVLAGGAILLGVYAFVAPMLGAVNKSDIMNLRSMFSSMGIISKLLEVPLWIAEKAVKLHPH